MVKRIKITENIAISTPRSNQPCASCGELVEGQGIIIYKNHTTMNLYFWVHLHCISNLNLPLVSSNYHSYFHANKNKCSYCDGTKNLQNMVGFQHDIFIHRRCIIRLIHDIREQLHFNAKLSAQLI